MIGGSPILHVVTWFALPLTVWVSIIIFLQGHNLPGGGFVAGVMVAAAGAVYLLAFGIEKVKNFPWWRLSVLGLICSVSTGAIPLFLGNAYMQHQIWFFNLPFIGYYELPTATFFDLGVYSIVLGTLMTIFIELAKEER